MGGGGGWRKASFFLPSMPFFSEAITAPEKGPLSEIRCGGYSPLPQCLFTWENRGGEDGISLGLTRREGVGRDFRTLCHPVEYTTL